MKNPIKATLAAGALAAPLVLGFAYTAGASVGDDSNDGGSHDEDQWTIEQDGSGEYILDRTEVDGVVTLIVSGPDGSVLGEDEIPEFIQDAVDEFGDADWEPNDGEGEADDPLDVVDGIPCYHADDVPEDRFGVLSISDDTTQGVERFEDGRFEAAYFDRAISQDEVESVVDNNGSYFDLDGAQELKPCS